MTTYAKIATLADIRASITEHPNPQRVAATANIEPTTASPTTDHGMVTEAERDRLDAGAPVCLEVRPRTLGWQLCWREDHHRGDHKSQDGQTWSSQ